MVSFTNSDVCLPHQSLTSWPTDQQHGILHLILMSVFLTSHWRVGVADGRALIMFLSKHNSRKEDDAWGKILKACF
ncbi:hypothetical protein CEXT_462161 [Caerostris extrusa]|uniref:Uncharacterized protein n=1 Tax=Caerostris extrusa TaxID=172846 RepID=A0AAV4P9W5_CAEEX|nr:hypothetical protein CEXT_462161 [Caerostris extrusa]